MQTSCKSYPRQGVCCLFRHSLLQVSNLTPWFFENSPPFRPHQDFEDDEDYLDYEEDMDGYSDSEFMSASRAGVCLSPPAH